MLPIPYKGTQPFLFVSYSHENKAAAYDLIFRLQKGGLRVWYDGGMEPGENWLQILPGRLKNCCCILALITREFTTSKWCPRELITGDNLDKTILPVFMERVVLPDSLQFLLADSNVLRSEVFSGDQEAFYSYLCGLKSLDGCRDAEPQPIPELPAEVPAAVEEAPDPWTLEPAGNPEDFLVSAGILTAYREAEDL